MTNKPWRTVIVGFGQVADGLGRDSRMARFFKPASHAQALADHPAFEWGAVVDTSDAALAQARQNWNIPHLSDDPAKLARDYEPEVAVLAVPPEGRQRIIDKLPSLKAVLVEKPLAKSLEETEAFLEACQRRQLLVQVNYWRRAAPGFRSLADGELAELIGPTQAAFASYGNGLRNNGSHLIDFVRMLLGEIGEARALGPPLPIAEAPIPGDVALPFALQLETGANVFCAPLDFQCYREVGLDIWGQRGRLAILQEGLGVYHYPLADNRGLENAREISSDHMVELTCPVGGSFREMYDNLAAALDGGGPLWSPGGSALRTETILQTLLRTALSEQSAAND